MSVHLTQVKSETSSYQYLLLGVTGYETDDWPSEEPEFEK